MANEFVNPNWHVAILHIPLGLLFAGVLIELFSFMYRRHAFRAAGRWMIFVGALSGIPVAMSGIYALADVSRMGLDPADANQPWRDVAAISPLWQDKQAAHMMRDHTWHMSIATALGVIVCVAWIGCSDRWRAKLHIPLLVLLLVATGYAASGAWHAGEGVYRHGVAVTPLYERAESLADQPEATTSPSATQAAQSTAASEQREYKFEDRIVRYIPPMQLHVVLAGMAVAIAMAALALSLRVISSGPGVPHVDHIAAALGTPESTGVESMREMSSSSSSTARATLTSDLPVSDLLRHRVPVARFWMLTVLLGLLTAGAGYWLFARGLETWDPQTMWNQIRDRDQNGGQVLTRRLVHVGSGVSIVVLSLILALISRAAPRAKFFLAFFVLLLLAVVVAQIWFGVLLMFDTNSGPITRFNT